ncbi:hypothetical protein GGP65_003352 [Salinibacter ruber]|nr:hypothetical protein [Salinibacter ruber]
MRRKDGAGQPRSLEKSPPKESPEKESPGEEFPWEESLKEESPLKESLLKGDLLRSFPLKKSSIEEFSIEEFSTQAVPLQRGRFALPLPQDFFCPRLTPPWDFLLPDPVGDSRRRDGPSGRRREKSRVKEAVSETGFERGKTAVFSSPISPS